jgi:hypothetical protein
VAQLTAGLPTHIKKASETGFRVIGSIQLYRKPAANKTHTSLQVFKHPAWAANNDELRSLFGSLPQNMRLMYCIFDNLFLYTANKLTIHII